MEDRRQPLTPDDIEKIAEAIAIKTRDVFHISEEKHYNDHQKLDRILEAYENAQSIFWKGFLSLVIVGAILLAGLGIVKGAK